MISDDIRQRIERLRHPAPRLGAAPGARLWRIDEVAGGVEHLTPRGVCLRVSFPATEAIESGARLAAEHRRLFRTESATADPEAPHSELARLTSADPERTVYLDIETCGLASAPLFLIGIMAQRGDTLAVDQFMARHYEEEPAAIEAVAERLARAERLVTFNGKSFDMPYIADRARVAGLPPAATPPHVDLLHEARRVYGRRFGNCKLQTLEYHVCGRSRVGDIPGALIPQVYHDFVRTGDARQIGGVLRHNALDLVTMADLVVKLLGGAR